MRVTVRDLMAAGPAAVSQECTIHDGLQKLLQETLAEIYVTDADGHLLGVVSEYELLKAQLASVSPAEPIAGLMSCNPMTFAPGDDVVAVAGVLRDGRYQRVAVVENGRLVGQISRHAVLRFIATDNEAAPDGTPHRPASAAPFPVGKPRFLHGRSDRAAEESTSR